MTWKSSSGVDIVFKFQYPELEGSEAGLPLEARVAIIEEVDKYLQQYPGTQVVDIMVFGDWEKLGIARKLDPSNNPTDALTLGIIFTTTAHERDDCIHCYVQADQCPLRAQIIFPAN